MLEWGWQRYLVVLVEEPKRIVQRALILLFDRLLSWSLCDSEKFAHGVASRSWEIVHWTGQRWKEWKIGRSLSHAVKICILSLMLRSRDAPCKPVMEGKTDPVLPRVTSAVISTNRIFVKHIPDTRQHGAVQPRSYGAVKSQCSLNPLKCTYCYLKFSIKTNKGDLVF